VPISGTVTGLEFFLNGNLAASLSGISIGTLTLLGLAQGGTTAALETIFGGNDSMLGSGFGDTLLGFGGNDTLNGGAGGADSLGGNAGNDSLFGGIGNDTISGGDGNDTLNGGTGTDRMVGGVNNDTYLVDAAGDVVIELVGQGIDTVRTTLATLSLASSVENMVATSAIAHTFTGNSLANAITGLTGADTLLGGVGNDTLAGGAGNDSMAGGDGTRDTLSFSGAAAGVNVSLAAGTAIGVTSGRDTVSGIEQVIGGNFNDTLTGGTGNDLLLGGAGADSIGGGDGDDIIRGGAGADTLRGGNGRDTFSWGFAEDDGATDNLRDFVGGAGGDTIDVSGLDANALVDGDQAFVIAGVAAAGNVVRSTQVLLSGTTTFYRFHQDNDGIADLVIAIAGNVTLTAGVDFVL
jgi:Ca2+-binding RTX toxin-like protein